MAPTGNIPNAHQQVNKHIVLNPYNRMLPRNLKEATIENNTTQGNSKYYAGWKKPDTKDHILHNPIYINP